MTSLGNLFHCLAVVTEKDFCDIQAESLLSVILPPCTAVKSPALHVDNLPVGAGGLLTGPPKAAFSPGSTSPAEVLQLLIIFGALPQTKDD